MKPIFELALQMMADPDLATKAIWKEVEKAQRLNRHRSVPGSYFCSAMLSLWIAARMAHLILADDEQGMAAFIEQVDPHRLVRDEIDERRKEVPHA